MITDEAALLNVIASHRLFWSKRASQSQWVDMEWRCALAARGLDYIHTVALVDPRTIPPPRELMAKHFKDLKRA